MQCCAFSNAGEPESESAKFHRLRLRLRPKLPTPTDSDSAALILLALCCKIAHRFSIVDKSGLLPGHTPFAQKPESLAWHHRAEVFSLLAVRSSFFASSLTLPSPSHFLNIEVGHHGLAAGIMWTVVSCNFGPLFYFHGNKSAAFQGAS